MANIGSFFRAAVSARLVDVAQVPRPRDRLQDGDARAAAALSPGNPFACP